MIKITQEEMICLIQECEWTFKVLSLMFYHMNSALMVRHHFSPVPRIGQKVW